MVDLHFLRAVVGVKLELPLVLVYSMDVDSSAERTKASQIASTRERARPPENEPVAALSRNELVQGIPGNSLDVMGVICNSLDAGTWRESATSNDGQLDASVRLVRWGRAGDKPEAASNILAVLSTGRRKTRAERIPESDMGSTRRGGGRRRAHLWIRRRSELRQGSKRDRRSRSS